LLENLVLQTVKVVRNSTEQLDRIKYLQGENDNLAKDILEIDNEVLQKQITIKQLILQYASNLEELYTLGDFQYPISCIYSVIVRNLELKGVSPVTKNYLWKLFSAVENRRYMYSTNELAALELDQQAKQAVVAELTQVEDKLNEAFLLIDNVNLELKPDAKSRQILQNITIRISELSPKLVDKCDRAGIALPTRQLKDEPIRIKKEDPQDNDLCGWLRLLIVELQKVHDKFLEYRTKDPEEMRWYTRGVKVHVQLLRSVTNDKWARNYYTWLGVIKQKVSQSNHSAQSLSGIWGQITGKRNLTREQIKAKTELVLQFAQEFIENSVGYWDLMYASTKLRENRIGDFHNNRHEKLSDSSIG
jgi:hypothetical protein